MLLITHSFTDISVEVVDSGFPSDVVVTYDVHQYKTTQTALSRLIRQTDTQGLVFRHRHYSIASRIYSELGSCAADLYWRHALAELDDSGDSIKESSNVAVPPNSVWSVRRELADVIHRWTFNVPDVERTSVKFNVSPKFAKLVEVLKERVHDEVAFRGLIFGMSTRRHA